MTCDEAKPFLKNRKPPQVVEQHIAACEPCRKAAGAERAFQEAFLQTMREDPADRTAPRWRPRRLWVNLAAFGLGIAIPVLMITIFRTPSELGAEALIAHVAVAKGKAKVVETSGIADYVRREAQFDIQVPEGELEGARIARLGPVMAAHLVFRRGDDRISVLIFPRAKLRIFIDAAEALQSARSLFRPVNEYHMLVQAGDERIGVVIGKITESEARSLLTKF